LSEVADQFEAIFIENLLKQARDSKLSDGLFDTNADDNFVEMFDRELANNSSKSVDIGIAKAIIQQMSQNKPGKI
jgi:flagellar protein FlgJ